MSTEPAPQLSSATRLRIELLFPAEQRDEVRTLLLNECGAHITNREDPDRLNFAVLKLSDGNLEKLHKALRLAKRDYRDLFMASGFGYLIKAHEAWMPEPR